MNFESQTRPSSPIDAEYNSSKETEAEPGSLIVITGGTASGKSAIAKRLLADFPQFSKIVTVTTREMRVGEVDGLDYHFITQDEFESLVGEHAFVEHTGVYGKSYGTLRSEVEKVLAGEDIVWLVDIDRGLDIANGDFFNREFAPELADSLREITTVILVDVTDRRVRRERYLKREQVQLTPDKIEKCKQQLRSFLIRFREELPGLTALRAIAKIDISTIGTKVFNIDNTADLDQAVTALYHLVDMSHAEDSSAASKS